MYKVLLFDADDTLFDFQACEKQALHSTFAKYHIALTSRLLQAFHTLNKTLWDGYEQGRLTREEVVFTRFVQLFQQFHLSADGIQFEKDYQDALAKGHQLMEGAYALLEELKHEYRLFVVSNGVVATQYQRLQDAGLLHFFEHIFLSEEVGSRKPQISFFEPVLQAAKPSEKKEILLIGDSLSSDIAGANRIGIDCVWMNPNKKTAPNNYTITYEIQHLYQLKMILDSLKTEKDG